LSRSSPDASGPPFKAGPAAFSLSVYADYRVTNLETWGQSWVLERDATGWIQVRIGK
jgi:hypothetical protein